MIIDNIMYHNFDSVEKTNQGMRLGRFSEKLMNTVNPHARYMARYACNCEMRFVTDANTCFVSLLSEEGSARVDIYYGDYMIQERILESGVITRINLTKPQPVSDLDGDFYKNNKFKYGVWRLHFHNTVITVCGVDTLGQAVRPPLPEEMPGKTMLSYGSSISHGSGAVYNPVSYVNSTAYRLGVDCLAKGVGGSCFIENEVADEFSARSDWDFALFELGVNMVDRFEVEVFKERFNYFADKMYQTGKKLVFLTMFPYTLLYRKNSEELQKKYRKMNEIIREKCSEFDKERVMLVEGSDILTTTEMLSADGIHPSTEGHIMMGQKLAEIIKDFVL